MCIRDLAILLKGYCVQMLHRLDVGTTGVLLLGRSHAASRRFSMDMQAHAVRKQYKVPMRAPADLHCASLPEESTLLYQFAKP